MAGVEILHSSEVLISGGFSEMSFISTLLVCTIIGILIGIINFIIDSEIEWMFVGLGMGILLGLGFGALVGGALSTPEEYETHYKVLVSDEVSMNEFLEHYEIVDQEGKIYTVKERTEIE